LLQGPLGVQRVNCFLGIDISVLFYGVSSFKNADYSSF
jgi:hypothetical protein